MEKYKHTFSDGSEVYVLDMGDVIVWEENILDIFVEKWIVESSEGDYITFSYLSDDLYHLKTLRRIFAKKHHCTLVKLSSLTIPTKYFNEIEEHGKDFLNNLLALK